MRGRETGYTLYELLVTTLVAAAVLTAAIPSFVGLLARQRQHVEINALFHAVHVARKESIMRRRAVSLCPSTDGDTCQPGPDWSHGWILFENRDRDWPPQVDIDEPVLTRHRVGSNVQIRANRHGFTMRSVFRRATNGTLVVCDPAGRIRARALVVSYTGRPRVAWHTHSGDPWSCAD